MASILRVGLRSHREGDLGNHREEVLGNRREEVLGSHREEVLGSHQEEGLEEGSHQVEVRIHREVGHRSLVARLAGLVNTLA